jgi:TRAP-type C4-dicarboxylate transport system permease small subunit
MDRSPAGRVIHWLAAALALTGGAIMIAITVMTVASIIGRLAIPLGLRPVPGDVEITQAGMAFAIFCFLPWCQLTRGHAIVTILSDRFPVRVTAVLEFVMDAVMLAAAIFIAWRLGHGLIDKMGNREQTFILRFPLWWSYAGSMIGAVAAAIVAAYCVVTSGLNAIAANPAPPASDSAE